MDFLSKDQLEAYKGQELETFDSSVLGDLAQQGGYTQDFFRQMRLCKVSSSPYLQWTDPNSEVEGGSFEVPMKGDRFQVYKDLLCICVQDMDCIIVKPIR